MKLTGTGYLMERISRDILGPPPETDEGNRYILVISDYFTKWVEAFAIPDQKAETVARCLVSEVISRFGVPSYIHSDQGRQFESELYQEVCFLLHIKKTRTTAYHPQSDGTKSHNAKEFQMEFVSNLQSRMEQAHEMAREHIQTEMRRQKRYHDNKLFWEKYSNGDEVYIFSLRKYTGRSPKFTYYWHGPYEVVEKYSDLNYKVKNKATCLQKVVHVDRMKRRYGREESTEVSRENNDEPEIQLQESSESQEVGKGGIFTDAEETIEEELGRRRRQRRRPTKFSDYVL